MRTIFIGDTHGCADELQDLLNAVAYDGDRLLLAGDAFARGPDPLGVWRLIEETGAEMVLGNHDARLLEQFEDWAAGREPKLQKPDQRYTFAQLNPVLADVRAWLRRVPLYIEDARFLLVHAGINPEKGLAGTSRDEFVAIRTWPPTRNKEDLRWHDYYKPAHPLLVFGHDAPGQLVVKRRDGRPYLLGLDTGCVYGELFGNQLTAYILEGDRLVHVPSRQHKDQWLTRDA